MKKRQAQKQYVVLFRAGLYLLILLLIFIVFIGLNALLSSLGSRLNNWQEQPNFEFQKILLSAFLTAVFSIIVKLVFDINKVKVLSKLYAFLCKQYFTCQSPIICKTIEIFINILYKGDFLPIQEQISLGQNILNDLKEISDGNHTSHLFLVNGEAHSGKTSLAKKIISDIFTKEDYINLLRSYRKSIFYYDFAFSQVCLEDILDGLKRGYYINKIVFFDNVHKLKNDEINLIIKHVVRYPDNAKYILLLTRDVSHILENDIIKEIEKNEKNHIIKIRNLPVLKFDNNFSKSKGFMDFISILNIDEQLMSNDFVKYHLFYIYYLYKRNKSKMTKRLFNQLNNFNFTDYLLKGFVFICTCALFTGIVNEDILKKWLKGKNASIFINTFVEIGIISKFQGIKISYYTLHEKTARTYIAYICKQQAGLKLCKEYFCFLYNNTDSELKYRYALPFEELRNKMDFDTVIRNGNFRILYEDINFIIDVFKLDKTLFEREIGLLNDRLGNFLLTKECVLDLYNQTKEEKYLITLLHADHMMYYSNDYQKKYIELTKSKDLYLNFASNYWVYHIKMHQGQWNFDLFINLCQVLPNKLEFIAKQSYDNFHVLRRFYFDCIRMYYLQGMASYDCFTELLKKIEFIGEYLEEKLPEFETYKYKFVYGHYIHYDLLFNFHILGKPPTKAECEFVGCQKLSDYESKAIEYYYKAYNSFKRNGDKTADYVLLRMCEISPVFVLKHILKKVPSDLDLVELTEDEYYAITAVYDDFRDRCGIKEHVMEYAAFAETYKLKFTLLCKMLCPKLDIAFDSIIDECASSALKYHNEYNKKYSNAYGCVRIQIFTLLNNYLITGDSLTLQTEFEKIKNVCANNNYNRELSLINYMKMMNFNIKIDKMRKIVQYYPIVLQ